MKVNDTDLIVEAIAINHKEIEAKTCKEYKALLPHWRRFFAEHGATFYTAQRKHVLLFMQHLVERDGEIAKRCSWCADEGFPKGRGGGGYSPNHRKKHLAALRFLYFHFASEETLPNLDPTRTVKTPKAEPRRQYVPTEDEVRRLLEAPGKPRDRLLAHLLYYAPSRRQPVTEMRWADVDLANGTWTLVGKWKKGDQFALHPVLAAEFRKYRRWQEQLAERHPAMKAALADPERAFVFMTRNGKAPCGTSIAKQLRWRAVRAGVAVIEAKGRWDAPGGKTSRLSPHSLRRAWASHAFHDADDPVQLEDIADVLKHEDLKTTRAHYIQAKPERARRALLNRRALGR